MTNNKDDTEIDEQYFDSYADLEVRIFSVVNIQILRLETVFKYNTLGMYYAAQIQKNTFWKL